MDRQRSFDRHRSLETRLGLPARTNSDPLLLLPGGVAAVRRLVGIPESIVDADLRSDFVPAAAVFVPGDAVADAEG